MYNPNAQYASEKQIEKGSLTIRPFSSPLIKNILVNCSTFVFD